MPILYKVLAGFILGASVIGGVSYWHSSQISKSYDKGYSDAALEYERQATSDLKKDLSDVTARLELTLGVYVKEAQIASEKATELSKLTDKQYQRLKEYEGVIVSPECSRLGDDFFRLYNKAIED